MIISGTTPTTGTSAIQHPAVPAPAPTPAPPPVKANDGDADDGGAAPKISGSFASALTSLKIGG